MTSPSPTPQAGPACSLPRPAILAVPRAHPWSPHLSLRLKGLLIPPRELELPRAQAILHTSLGILNGTISCSLQPLWTSSRTHGPTVLVGLSQIFAPEGNNVQQALLPRQPSRLAESIPRGKDKWQDLTVLFAVLRQALGKHGASPCISTFICLRGECKPSKPPCGI